MMYAIGMGSGSMKYMMIGSGIQKMLRGYTFTQTKR
jgi:hypothetical protein